MPLPRGTPPPAARGRCPCPVAAGGPAPAQSRPETVRPRQVSNCPQWAGPSTSMAQAHIPDDHKCTLELCDGLSCHGAADCCVRGRAPHWPLLILSFQQPGPPRMHADQHHRVLHACNRKAPGRHAAASCPASSRTCRASLGRPTTRGIMGCAQLAQILYKHEHRTMAA